MSSDKKHRFGRNWMNEHVNDSYVKKAKKAGYRARSAFKLEEIDKRDRLLRPGMNVVDLGAAPGSWCQYARTRLGKKDHLVAVDLLPIDPIDGVVFIQGDFTEDKIRSKLREIMDGRGIDLVLSDMAPNISGIALSDQARSIGLAEGVLDWSRSVLVRDGTLLMKVFQGSGFDQLRQELLTVFRSVATRKPGASRSRSSEVFLLARGFKG
ncbi:MAG: RlmE family RNA methyltransferase [Gammaproteobacteria bacterium]|nr:MAG: RlmE family RNA methyltransferase [Gammaproteobacteria bacterium]